MEALARSVIAVVLKQVVAISFSFALDRNLSRRGWLTAASSVLNFFDRAQVVFGFDRGRTSFLATTLDLSFLTLLLEHIENMFLEFLELIALIVFPFLVRHELFNGHPLLVEDNEADLRQLHQYILMLVLDFFEVGRHVVNVLERVGRYETRFGRAL